MLRKRESNKAALFADYHKFKEKQFRDYHRFQEKQFADYKKFQAQQLKSLSVQPASYQSGGLLGAQAWKKLIVKRGHTLEIIARSYGLTARALMEMNHLHSRKLRIGQIIQVPLRAASSGRFKSRRTASRRARR